MHPNSPPLAEPDHIHSPSLRQRLKSSLKLPSCFHVPHHERFVYATPRLVRSATSRFGSRGAAGHDHSPPDHHFKERAKHFISSHLGGSSRHRRRHSSADFHYDQASYSLNFDDGGVHEGDDGSPDDVPPPFRTFSSRLPASPPPRAVPLPKSQPPDLQPKVFVLVEHGY